MTIGNSLFLFKKRTNLSPVNTIRSLKFLLEKWFCDMGTLVKLISFFLKLGKGKFQKRYFMIIF